MTARHQTGDGPLDASRASRTEDRAAAFVLVSSYAFGAVMLGHAVVDGFVRLTAAHLCLTTWLLLRAHDAVGVGVGVGERIPRSGRPLLTWAVLCGALGWGAEYVGVHYGFLFGAYAYGDVLGPELGGIPLVMGVNWVLVTYAICASLDAVAPRWSAVAKTALAALGLVALDVLIEPVAIRLGFWMWDAGEPPLHNYLGWLAVGAVQAGTFYKLLPRTRNRRAPLVLTLQIAFFAYLAFALA